MSKNKLELPPTIRIPREDELPANSTVLERLKQIQTANIIPGYRIQQRDKNLAKDDIPYSFYAEINVDNSMLWNVLLALAETLPQQAAVLFGHCDFELNYGTYTQTTELLQFLAQYKKEFTQDPFLNFGLLYHDKEQLIEIFIDECKYIKFWGTDEVKFRSILSSFDLEEVESIEFIDEYPKVRENLINFYPNATTTNDLIQLLLTTYS